MEQLARREIDLEQLARRAIDLVQLSWRAIDLEQLAWRAIDLVQLAWRAIDGTISMECNRLCPISMESNLLGTIVPYLSWGAFD